MEYPVIRATAAPGRQVSWEDPAWANAPAAQLAAVRPEGSDHRPGVSVRLAYDDSALHGVFRVADRYVRSVCTEYNGPVCEDSCVEFFVKPLADKGYLNFEMNCGGVLLCSYIEDAERTPGGFRRFTRLPLEHLRLVRILTTMPRKVDPEISGPVLWLASFSIPLGLLAAYLGELGPLAGQEWRANFYKCGDKTSHPHWLSWAPVAEKNFHRPQDFGILRFLD